MKKKIFLTGGSGMVGRNILEHPKKFSFLTPTSQELDLRNFNLVQEYLGRYLPDYIIHAAGLVGGIQANIAKPVDYLIANCDIGRNVVLAARNVGIKKLINISSSCMYPRNGLNPLSESLILKGELEPTNEGYALAKIMVTRLCEYINRENEAFSFKTLVPCNLYGRYDKFDPNLSHLIAAIIHKIHKAKVSNQKSVEIWGSGTVRREFMYAGDFGGAVLRAIENFESLPNLMNVGCGVDYSINEYYEIVSGVVGWKGDFFHNLLKPTGMSKKLVSISLQSAWGWTSETPLLDGVAKTYDYYLEEIANEL